MNIRHNNKQYYSTPFICIFCRPSLPVQHCTFQLFMSLSMVSLFYFILFLFVLVQCFIHVVPTLEHESLSSASCMQSMVLRQIIVGLSQTRVKFKIVELSCVCFEDVWGNEAQAMMLHKTRTHQSYLVHHIKVGRKFVDEILYLTSSKFVPANKEFSAILLLLSSSKVEHLRSRFQKVDSSIISVVKFRLVQERRVLFLIAMVAFVSRPYSTHTRQKRRPKLLFF